MPILSRSDLQWAITQALVVSAIVLSLILLPSPTTRPIPSWCGIVLCVLSGVTIVAAFLAHALVNRTPRVNICPQPDPKKTLVVQGIYRYVRHPMYLSAALLLLGAAIWHGNAVAIGGGLMAWLFFYLKAIHEERLLLQVYPDYPSYMMRSGRLFPRLRRIPNKKT